MARVPRRTLPDGVYHVSTRAVAGERAFRDATDCRTFVEVLLATIRRFSWELDTFCLMTTHYHLLLASTREQLSSGVRHLNGTHARAFNQRHGRRGHLFGDRFGATLVESEEHLSTARRYILLNPVKAGLCRTSVDWPWSDSRHGRRVD